MNAYFWEMGCLEAVETTVPIKVGLKESSQEALIAEFGEELVGKASRAWSILMNEISYQALVDLISATCSPSEGGLPLRGITHLRLRQKKPGLPSHGTVSR